MFASGTAKPAAGFTLGTGRPASTPPAVENVENVVTALQVVGLVLVFIGGAFLVVAVLAWIRGRRHDRRPPRHRR